MSRYVMARSVLLRDVYEEIRGREPDLTDHGPEHIQHVLENVFKLLKHDFNYFRPLEHYILGLGVLFHDVGNLHGRKGHNKRIARFYDHVRRGEEKFNQEKSLVFRISQAHSGKAMNGSSNTLADVPPDSQLDGEPVRTREVAAIVRFADELAEGPQRTSSYMREHGFYSPESIPYHDYSSATNIAIDTGNERIAITYQFSINTKKGIEDELSKLQKSLTFAWARLGKVDLERRYARFHCPRPLEPFRKISVCLNIQIDGEFVEEENGTISDEVSLDEPAVSLPERDANWDPKAIVARVREEISRLGEN